MKKIAYLILAHADPAHFKKLIAALNYNADFFVHLDAKSKIKPFRSLALPANLTFLQNRLHVSWGGISMVNATLRLIETALQTEQDFTHLVLLSGADYPIKKASFIYETLVNNPRHEFIRYIDMRHSAHYIKHISQKWFKEPMVYKSNAVVRLSDKIIRNLGNRMRFRNRWNEGVIPYFGSQWWALTPACAQYILDFVRTDKNFYKNNKNTFAPDEHFFHTIVGNSPFNINSDGVQEFQGRGTWRLANLHIIDPSLAKWFDLSDRDQISSSDKLFVRKLNSRFSSELVDQIDKKILNS